MRRMKEADARELFAFVADRIDIESIPLDDDKTYELLSKDNTDGVYMMESNWGPRGIVRGGQMPLPNQRQ